MRKTIIAGNWKMNKTASETTAFINELKPLVASLTHCDIVVCPPATNLVAAIEACKGSNISVGSQNVHWEVSGAFTGELSTSMLLDLGVKYVIIGHSERRQYFGETDETVNLRTKAALDAGLIPLTCIGELLEERETGKTEEVLEKQIRIGFNGLSADDMKKVVIAYEPVWAIGTGKTATPEMAQETHAFIRKVVASMFDQATADVVRIQYGGSMNAANAADLTAQADIDGGLIGGAALKADTFTQLITNAK